MKFLKRKENKANKILFFKPPFVVLYFLLNCGLIFLCYYSIESTVLIIICTSLIVFLFLIPFILRVNKSYKLTLVGYLWMGNVIFFYCIFAIMLPISHLTQTISVKESIYISSFISVFLTFFSFRKIENIQIKIYDINSNKLEDCSKPIKFVHITDLHWGLFVREAKTEKIVKKINRLQPDVIVFSGDIVDGQAFNFDSLAKILKKLKASIVKVAVMGNHEELFSDEKIKKMFMNAGFVLLADEIYNICDKVAIIGLTENYKSKKIKIDQNKYNIIVRHTPLIDEKLNFNLQLSGHTHGGQFFPITLLTKFLFKYNYGFHKLDNNKAIYVSSGVGSWLPPLRLGTLPEIAVFKLKGV